MKAALALIVTAGLSGLLAAPVRAQQVTWDLINEYPATSLAGEADVVFADAVRRRIDGRVVIRPMPNAISGLRSREQLQAVSDGRFAMANCVGGTLGGESAGFLLSSLPLVARSADDARELYEAARPLYEKLFAARGQKLLYVLPWPASGIWSAGPVRTVDALKALRIRTYDTTGTDVFGQVADKARVISFSDLNAKLESGEINAVLSSGDGGAGRELWKYLRYYSEIGYAVPLSFGSVSVDAWMRLDERTRAAVEEAGRETTERQWAALASRDARNYARMRDNGVSIDEQPPPDVLTVLRAAAAKSLSDWRSRADADAIAVLDRYNAGKLR
jgi:TRAP-type transport system periplasmic protein